MEKAPDKIQHIFMIKKKRKTQKIRNRGKLTLYDKGHFFLKPTENIILNSKGLKVPLYHQGQGKDAHFHTVDSQHFTESSTQRN